MNTSKVFVGAGKLTHHIASSQNRMIIKGGTLYFDDTSLKADIYIEDGKIKEIGNSLAVPGGIRVVNAKGKLVLPGAVDAETHFQFKFNDILVNDDVYLGSKKALSGGNTTIVESIIPNKNESLVKAFERTVDLLNQKSNCDFSLKCQIIDFCEDSTLKEIDILCTKGVGIYHISSETFSDTPIGQLNSLLAHLSKKSCLLSVSSFDSKSYMGKFDDSVKLDNYFELYDPSKDKSFVLNIIELAKKNSCSIVFTDVISEDIAKVITEEHFMIIPASHLGITRPNGGDFTSKCFKYILPPLLEDDKRKNLIQFITKELKNIVISSSHKGFSQAQKTASNGLITKIPPGCGGCVERLSVVWDHCLSKNVNHFVNLACTNPAKLMKIYPRKGTLKVGSDADILIWDPDMKRNLGKEEQVPFSNPAFSGNIAVGCPYIIIANGKVVFDEEMCLRVVQGSGRFIPTDITCSDNIDTLEPTSDINACNLEKNSNGDESKSLNEIPVKEIKEITLTPEESKKENPSVKNPNGYHSSIKIHNPPGGKSSGLW